MDGIVGLEGKSKLEIVGSEATKSMDYGSGHETHIANARSSQFEVISK